MSTTAKSIIFLAVTFGFSWGAVFIGAVTGAPSNPIATFWIEVAMMAGPAVGALACTFAFEKGRRIDTLGLGFKPNIWWLYAWLIPLAICATAFGLTMLAGHPFTAPARVIRDMLAHANVPPAQIAKLNAIPDSVLNYGLIPQVAIGTLINGVAITFTEELGWRGYLHSLWRSTGFWRASLATGAIWGVWHAPAILIFGLNYPDHRLIGIPLFIVFCTMLAPVMTLIRDRAGATWAAGLAHGTINALAGVIAVCLGNPAFPWSGLVGIGGFIALAAALAAVALARPALAPQAVTA